MLSRGFGPCFFLFIFFYFFSLSLAIIRHPRTAPIRGSNRTTLSSILYPQFIMTNPRPIRQIASDIRRHWPKPYFGAVPYLEAMYSLNSLSDKYYDDSAKSIVLYFLSNAATWRGEDAKRIKGELKSMLK